MKHHLASLSHHLPKQCITSHNHGFKKLFLQKGLGYFSSFNHHLPTNIVINRHLTSPKHNPNTPCMVRYISLPLGNFRGTFLLGFFFPTATCHLYLANQGPRKPEKGQGIDAEKRCSGWRNRATNLPWHNSLRTCFKHWWISIMLNYQRS